VPRIGPLAPVARPSGGFAIVAMDQRESLRAMFADAGGRASDAELVSFKVAVTRVLSPSASALLLDVDYGVAPALDAHALAPSCALIVAADRLEQRAGGPVTDTDLDERIDPGAVRAFGAVALKLLVVWRDDRKRDRRREMVERFTSLCADSGLASVVEGVVRGPEGFDREAGIVESARELGARCDLYKAEVPLFGRATHDEIAERARARAFVGPRDLVEHEEVPTCRLAHTGSVGPADLLEHVTPHHRIRWSHVTCSWIGSRCALARLARGVSSG
jgi:sulfofructosephosphate aldolase